MSQPLISVIIPTYNRRKRVVTALNSVLGQTFKDFEVILVDDGSRDGTLEEIQTVSDSRLQTLRRNRSGVSAARNAGVSISRGAYIAFLDSDDSWQPDKLRQQVLFHQNNPELAISQTQEIWIRRGKRVNPKQKHLKPQGDIFSSSLSLCTITPSSVFLTRELFELSGGFDEKMPACEDYDLWLRITACHPVGLIDETLLTKYGGHDDQLSMRFPAMDRFRIYSLGKIILSGSLSSSQRAAAFQVLKQKTLILLNGIRKRQPDARLLIDFLESLSTLTLSREAFLKKGISLLLADTYFK